MIIVCSSCDSSFRVPNGSISPEGRFVKCSVCDHEWIVKPSDVINEDSDKTPEPQVTIQKQEELKQEATAEAPTIQEKQKEEVQQPVIKEEAKPEIKVAEKPKDTKIKTEVKRFVIPKKPIHERNIPYYGSMVASILATLLFFGSLLIYKREELSHSVPSLQKVFNLISMEDTSEIKLEMVDCTLRQLQSASDNNKLIEVEVDVMLINTAQTPKTLDSIRFSIYDIERNFIGELIMDAKAEILPNEKHRIEGRLNRVPIDSFYVAVDIGNTTDLFIRRINKINSIY